MKHPIISIACHCQPFGNTNMQKIIKVIISATGLTLIATAAITSTKFTLAQEHDGCFIVNPSGKVISLNNLCAGNGKSITGSSGKLGVVQVPIKRRSGGTPVVEVTLNGSEKFEMILDTGASGTVITQKMADKLGLTPTGTVKVDTASAKGVAFATSKLNSIAVNGLMANNLPVTIGGPDLDIGLLGQNFFGDYDVTIKKDVIEFHLRS